MKLLAILALILFTSNSIADEILEVKEIPEQRKEIIWDILQASKVLEMAADITISAKKEILRLYPDITPSMLENEFSDIFDEYERVYAGAYAATYNELNDEELVKLHKFYKSETGIWMTNMLTRLNPQAVKYTEIATRNFNDKFIVKFRELGFDPYNN